MTDGERLVWAASYARVFDRSGDAIVAARSAAHAIIELRAAAVHRSPDGDIVEIDAKDFEFLDEMVNVP